MIEAVEEIVELSMLYDFYGELLNDRKKTIFEEYVLNDLSLTEIADMEGISRQGVHDIVRRCTKQLKEYEDALHLVEKFRQMKKKLSKVQELLRQAESSGNNEALKAASGLLDEAMETL